MKSVLNQVLVIIFAFLFSPAVSAQIGLTGTDSVTFVSAKFDKFTFPDGGTREIKVKSKLPKIAEEKGKNATRNAGNGLLTIMTGIGFGSSDEVSLKVPGIVTCNDGLPEWEVALFCEGYQETSRERVRDDDGSFSVNSETIYTFYWEKGATGVITEGDYEVGSFRIVMNPREDSLLKPMADYYLLPAQVQEVKEPNTIKEFLASLENPEEYAVPKDYGIQGVFRGESFSVVSDGRQNKSWIFYNNNYLCMVFGGSMMNHKVKGVPDPYILIEYSESGPERRDLFRLAMVLRYLNYALAQ